MGIYKRADISPIQIKQKPPAGGPGTPGEDDEEGEDGEDGQGGEDGEDEEGNSPPGWDEDEGEDGEEGGDKDTPTGKPGKQGNGKNTRSDIEKSIEEKLSKRKDMDEEDLKKEEEAAQQNAGKPAPLKTGDPSNLSAKTSTHKPMFGWKELIRQFVASQAPPEITYTRPSARSATQVDIARQLGAAAIKPGERPGEDIFKLLMVFDTSGSMSGAIGPALSETRALLSKMSASLDAAVGITFFASTPVFFAANLRDNKAWSVPSFNVMTKPVPANSKRALDEVLKSSMSGGTDFNAGLAAELSTMAAKGYNIVLFSDTDLLYGDNWTNFVNLYKSHKQKLFFIADNSYSYNAIITKLGVQPKTFGHL